MSTLAELQSISTPLTGTTLIEASAGTGKTYTMASLYIRLLLQLGDNAFPRALSVPEILVVTFTEASTQELKERIRQRIHLCRQQIKAYQLQLSALAQMSTAERQQAIQLIFKDNQPLADLLLDQDYHPHRHIDFDLAELRLRLAEQNMDLAAIYTIHGFCHRMLMQYALQTGSQFELDLVTDETPLLQQFANQFWREQFYPLDYLCASFIHQHLKSPQNVLRQIKSYVKGDMLKVAQNPPQFLQLGLQDFLQQYVQRAMQQIIQLKQQWISQQQQIVDLIQQAVADKKLNSRKFQSNHMVTRLAKINQWVQDETDYNLPDSLTDYFSQQKLLSEDFAGKNPQPVTHEFFANVDAAAQIDFGLYQKVVLYHYIQDLNQKLNQYKQTHAQKSFDDLLRLLRDALFSAQGDELANRIRSQYPFAMIDEFQDTDERQYQIFAKLYQQQADCGFIMIGDPKQAIYKFRGADIFTYLKAAQQAQCFTLKQNFRSAADLIQSVNQIFDFKPAPFLYEQIRFEPVGVGKAQGQFCVQGEPQAAIQFHIGDVHSTAKNGDIKLNKGKTQQLFAEVCADSIAKWLAADKSAVQNQVSFVKGDEIQPVKDNDIAVLVENWHQAKLIQQSLRQRGIASVYLSDRSNVFATEEAKELVFVLAACLNPLNISAILTAVATSLFALSAADIQQIKHNDQLLENWVNRFENYHRLWLNQGVLAMLYQLFLQAEPNQPCILQKLGAQPNAERRITDLLHLAELLQQASPLNESEASLLRWFERQIQQNNDDNPEQQLRLESENQRVKIVTIHKSKGLEYGLVWLPFIGLSSLRQPDIVTTYYHQQDEQQYWDMQSLQGNLVLKENMAEKMRLLYVALTRARYQVNIALPEFLCQDWTAIWYALSRAQIGELANPAQIHRSLELVNELKQQNNAIEVCQIEAEKFAETAEQALPIATSHKLQAAEFNGKIEQDWGLSSFSALIYNHQRNQQKLAKTQSHELEVKTAVQNSRVFDYAKDEDQQQPYAAWLNSPPAQDWADYPANYAPVDFPQGSQVGTLLHYFLEKQDFSQPLNPQGISKICQQLQLDENWLAPLTQWLNNVVRTPLLADGFRLAQLQPQHCLKELQFYLNLPRTFEVQRFNQLLQQHHELFAEPLQFDNIRGMLRGFIDLVFRHQGKYYIVDYKSNFLGSQPQDYGKAQLAESIKQQHYDVQYLLYSLALHRYLSWRDADYDYETHFGGVIYTFLRGMNGQNQDYGVFFARPSQQLIQQLGELFDA